MLRKPLRLHILMFITQVSRQRREKLCPFPFSPNLMQTSYDMTNELPTLSEHVLSWILNEEEITQDFRDAIESELLRRTLERDTDEMLTLTSKMLHDASTKGYHGFNAKQLKVIGLKWPPKKGWLKSLIGTQMLASKYRQFVAAGKK